MKLAISAAAFGAVLVLGATAQTPAPPAPAARKLPVQIKLAAENSSAESGTATLLDGTKGLIVRLRMEGGGELKQPAHIHKGTCDKLDPKPAYPLTTVTNGQSETTVPGVTLADLAKSPFAINVHKSTTEVPVYVACGNLAKTK